METQRYLYETHMHTSEASACAGSTGAQMARAYKEAGYTGIIVTDHFFKTASAKKKKESAKTSGRTGNRSGKLSEAVKHTRRRKAK